MDQKIFSRNYYFWMLWFFILLFALESGISIYESTFGLYFSELPGSWKIVPLTEPLFYVAQFFYFLQLLMVYFLFKKYKLMVIQIFLSCYYCIISFMNILIAFLYAIGYLQFSLFKETLFFPRSIGEVLFSTLFLLVNLFIIFNLLKFIRMRN